MEPYRITFRPSGRTITAEPAETILEAALRQGLSLSSDVGMAPVAPAKEELYRDRSITALMTNQY